MKLIDKIINFFMETPVEEKKEKKNFSLYEDTETRDLDDTVTLVTEDFSEYWWCYKIEGEVNIPIMFSGEQEQITKKMNADIDSDKFPLIEIPSTVMEIMSKLQNPEFIFGEINSMVNKSPGLSGEFIKVANSSLYSRGIETSDLSTALPRLGKDNIRAILYMYSSKMSFSKESKYNILAEKIIEHSYATGLIASYLSQRFFPNPDTAFLAGLLHNIGKLGILKALPDVYEIPEDFTAELSEAMFDEIFPGLYEKAGSALAENWNLDPTVLLAIKHHNNYMEEYIEDEIAMHLSALINISALMARMLGYGRIIDHDIEIFGSLSTIELNIERDKDTIKFLEDIPRIVSFKSDKK